MGDLGGNKSALSIGKLDACGYVGLAALDNVLT